MPATGEKVGLSTIIKGVETFSSPPRERKVEGEDWLLYSAVIQSAERAILEKWTSSIMPSAANPVA